MLPLEPADDFLVLLVQTLRRDDLRDDELVALLLPAMNAAALDAELRVAARAGRDRQRDGALERRHFHLRAEQRLVQAQREVEEDVQALAAEVGVRVDLRDDEQVA